MESNLDLDQTSRASSCTTDPRTLEEVKTFALGEWISLSLELRPAEDRTGQGIVQPTRLTRRFRYLPDDRFEGRITLFMDDLGQAPLMRFEFRGHLRWGGAHPVCQGAWAVDYILDEGFAVTPLCPPAAQMLNSVPVAGLGPFTEGVSTRILGRAFPLFNIVEGQVVVDFDLICFRNGLLFMGAKHVDGTPFDRPDRRPHQLQIPLRRVESLATGG